MEEQDFLYERRKLPGGVKLEIVSGGARYKGKVWREMARQIYCENGKDGYREIGHFNSGAPFLYSSDESISISHTDGCFAVASVKGEKPVGVDVESASRSKVNALRERFLSDGELKIVSPDSTETNILAWTCKEAMLKAGRDAGVNWKDNIVITELPRPNGRGYMLTGDGRVEMKLYSVTEEGFIITVAQPWDVPQQKSPKG